MLSNDFSLTYVNF